MSIQLEPAIAMLAPEVYDRVLRRCGRQGVKQAAEISSERDKLLDELIGRSRFVAGFLTKAAEEEVPVGLIAAGIRAAMDSDQRIRAEFEAVGA